MELEELVPDIELCKLIPEGEFADSCFVRIGTDTIIPRSDVRIVNGKMQSGIYPAPTLPELLLACPLGTEAGTEHHGDFWASHGVGYDQLLFESANSADCALKIWLAVRGLLKLKAIDAQKTEKI